MSTTNKGVIFCKTLFRSNYIDTVPSQKTKTIATPFYGGDGVRNANNNSSYRPAPPPQKKEFSIVRQINYESLSMSHRL